VDITPPTVTCPSDITRCKNSAANITVTWEAQATDNCSGPLTAQWCDPAPGSAFPVGTTLVRCLALDQAGNVGSCGFYVFVLDTYSLQTQIAQLNAAIADKERQIQLIDRNIANVVDQIQALQDELSDLRAARDNLQLALDRVRQAVQAGVTIVDFLALIEIIGEPTWAVIREKLGDAIAEQILEYLLDRNLEAVEDEIAELSDEVDALTDDVVALYHVKETYEDMKRETLAGLYDMQNQLEALQSQLNQLDAQCGN
jgi:phage shock protein A